MSKTIVLCLLLCVGIGAMVWYANVIKPEAEPGANVVGPTVEEKAASRAEQLQKQAIARYNGIITQLQQNIITQMAIHEQIARLDRYAPCLSHLSQLDRQCEAMWRQHAELTLEEQKAIANSPLLEQMRYVDDLRAEARAYAYSLK